MYPITHGNYCGAYWSDGRFQSSVRNGRSIPVDAVDAVCQRHDSNLASGVPNVLADQEFIQDIQQVPGITARLAEGLIRLKLAMAGQPATRAGAVAIDAAGRATPHMRAEPREETAARISRRFTPSEENISAPNQLAVTKMAPKNVRPKPANNAPRKLKGGFGRETSAPVAFTRTFTSVQPEASTLKDGSVRIRHRELITDLTGTSTAFTIINTASVNPGLGSVFPWLSTVAMRFEKYKFHNLKFLYDPESSTAGAGCLMMAVDFDASDVAPITKTQMMSYAGATKAAPWISSMNDVRAAWDKTIGHRFVRNGSNPSGTDIKLYDVGTLYIATSGVASALLGDLYVEYDVSLITPQTQSAIGGSIVANGSISASAIFGATPIILGSLPCSVSVNSFTFNIVGKYVVSMAMTGTTSNNVLTGTATGGGANGTVQANNYISTGSAIYNIITVSITQAGQYLTATPNGTCTANVVYVSLLPNAVTN
jgi:hypothetical protein